MRKLLLVVGALILVGCTQDHEKVQQILTADGFTNITVGGYNSMACSEKDTYSNAFTAQKNGMLVKGTVCAAAWKDNTIRISSTSPIVRDSTEVRADSIIAARRLALIDSLKAGTFR